MNPALLSSEAAKDFAGKYLQYLRLAADETSYNLTKLLYCYHRFYNKQYMVEVIQYSLVTLVFELSRTRRQLRLLPPLDKETRDLLQRTTDSLVRFVSVELNLYEEQQHILMESLHDNTRQDYLTRSYVQNYLKSDKGKDFAATMSMWINAAIDDADKLVKDGDEHARGECPYVEQYIRQNVLYSCIQELLNILDPIISWVKFHIRLDNAASLTPKLFLSYRRDEDRAMTGRIYDKLCSHFGVETVFLDLFAMPLGIDFRHHLYSAISQADVLLAVIGKQWLAIDHNGKRRIDNPADFVRVEVEAALEREIPVVPILIDEASMPSESSLPSSLARLSYRNAVKVDSGYDFHNHMTRLISGLEYLLEERRSRRC